MFQSRHVIALCFWLSPTQVIFEFSKLGARSDRDSLKRLVAFWKRLRSNKLTPAVLALSIALGLAVGLLPVYGLHGVLVAALCLPLRLDTVLAFAATMISNPFTFPVLTWVEVQIGCQILGGVCPGVEGLLRGEGIAELGYQLAVGSGVTAVLVGAMGAGITWLIASRLQAIALLPKG
jgi:uncharacterized protein